MFLVLKMLKQGIVFKTTHYYDPACEYMNLDVCTALFWASSLSRASGAKQTLHLFSHISLSPVGRWGCKISSGQRARCRSAVPKHSTCTSSLPQCPRRPHVPDGAVQDGGISKPESLRDSVEQSPLPNCNG